MAVVAIASLGVLLTFIVSWTFSKTVLKGEASTFSLELPPYRPPNIVQTVYTSIIDRTLFVLWRAVVFALPAGAAIWLSSNITIGNASIAEHMITFLQPVGWLMGLNGVILVAYIVAIPANEIVIPTILMLTVLVTGQHELGAGAGVMFEVGADEGVQSFFNLGGWTVLTAINLMIFSLIHNPCSTTIYTIYKETKSAKWTTVAALMPIALGVAVTASLAAVWRLAAGIL
jgi:ferrous iron transport protein B